jgi:collagen type VI alpha
MFSLTIFFSGQEHGTSCCYLIFSYTVQLISDVCTPYKKADFVFVIDTSMSEYNITFDKHKQYVQNFVSKYQVGPPSYRYQFSLVTFSRQATVHFYLNTFNNNSEIQNAIDHLTVDCGGPSLTGTALKKVREDVLQTANGVRDPADVERYIILLSDGLSSDPNIVIAEANALKVSGVKIYSVGSGLSIRHEELLEISSFNHYVFPMATEDCLQTLLKYTMFGCDSMLTHFILILLYFACIYFIVMLYHDLLVIVLL